MAPAPHTPFHTLLGLDFDETLLPTYQFSIPAWEGFLAEWMVTHGLFASLPEAQAQMRVFDNPYGCGPTFMARQFGKNKAFIEAFYQAASPLVLQANVAGNLQPHPHLKPELLRLQASGYYPLIISQAHRDFILPLLQHLQLSDLFTPLQVVDRAHKRLEPLGYQVAKALTAHLKLQNFIMCDDSAPNFSHAKAEGFTTVLIHPTPTAEALGLADHHAPDLVSYLQTLK
jgi:FMN phosphatase YigB (HAD superfamily)